MNWGDIPTHYRNPDLYGTTVASSHDYTLLPNDMRPGPVLTQSTVELPAILSDGSASDLAANISDLTIPNSHDTMPLPNHMDLQRNSALAGSTFDHIRSGLDPLPGSSRTEHSNGQTKFVPWAKQKAPCKYCGQSMLKKTLLRHVRDKHSSQQQPVRCTYCNQTYSRADVLERHEREQHGALAGESGTTECVYCNQHVRDRAMKEHFRSRKCVEAQQADGRSVDQDPTHFQGASSLRNFIVDHHIRLEGAIDAMRVCCRFWFMTMEISFLQDETKPVDSRKPLLDRIAHSEHRISLLDMREHALRLTNRNLKHRRPEFGSIDDPLLKAVSLLQDADAMTFGERSSIAKAHAWYLEAAGYKCNVNWWDASMDVFMDVLAALVREDDCIANQGRPGPKPQFAHPLHSQAFLPQFSANFPGAVPAHWFDRVAKAFVQIRRSWTVLQHDRDKKVARYLTRTRVNSNASVLEHIL